MTDFLVDESGAFLLDGNGNFLVVDEVPPDEAPPDGVSPRRVSYVAFNM